MTGCPISEVSCSFMDSMCLFRLPVSKSPLFNSFACDDNVYRIFSELVINLRLDLVESHSFVFFFLKSCLKLTRNRMGVANGQNGRVAAI